MKRIIAIGIILGLLFTSAIGIGQTNEYMVHTAGSTADSFIDSMQVPNNRRVHIAHIFAWYDNAANTNTISVEWVEGMSAMASQGFTGRLFKHSEAMGSAVARRLVFEPVNIMTKRDSTIYVAMAATGSDSMMFSYTYRLIHD